MIDEGLIEDHYPTEEALRRIRDFKGTPDDLIDLVDDLLVGMGYGQCWWGDYEGEGMEVTFITGGWSGCEDVLSQLEKTMFHLRFWESTHRGGKVIYRVPDELLDTEGFWGSYV